MINYEIVNPNSNSVSDEACFVMREMKSSRNLFQLINFFFVKIINNYYINLI